METHGGSVGQIRVFPVHRPGKSPLLECYRTNYEISSVSRDAFEERRNRCSD